MIDRGKRSKTLNEVKPVENTKKNQQNFLEINPVQKEVLPSHKLQPFRIKGIHNHSQQNFQSQLIHPSLSHIDQECQENLIQEKTHIQ